MSISLWLSHNKHGNGWLFGLEQPTGGLKNQVCNLYHLRVGGHVALADFHADDQSGLSHVAFLYIIAL